MSADVLMGARWSSNRRKRPKHPVGKPTYCTIAGRFHQSGLEAARCDELHLMEHGGLIYELEAHPQPRYDFEHNGVHLGTYLPDFRYRRKEDGELVVEDVKGSILTEKFRVSERMMLAFYGIEVEIVRQIRRMR